jgi:chromosome segregation ATPase
MKNVAHPDYELRAGTLLHDPINKEFSKILTPRNITEDLCLYHIAFNKDALSYFTRVPEDLNDRLEKFMSRYGKEMPDKDVEIKKRQAQVLSKQIDSVKAELEELNKKQIELNAKLDEYSKAMEAIHAILDSASAEEKTEEKTEEKIEEKIEEKTEEKTEEKPADIDTEVKEFIDAGMDLEAIKEAYADSQMSAGEIEEAYNRVVNPVSETPKKGAKKGGSK